MHVTRQLTICPISAQDFIIICVTMCAENCKGLAAPAACFFLPVRAVFATDYISLLMDVDDKELTGQSPAISANSWLMFARLNGDDSVTRPVRQCV